MTAETPEIAHLKETTLARQLVYQGDFLQLRRDTVQLPDGSAATREFIQHPGAVVIIPMLDEKHVLLEQQFRYPVQQVMLEFPAGKLDANETPLACAQRELWEETGYRASQWAYVGVVHLAIGYSDEIIHLYFARELTAGQRKLDVGEFLDVMTMSVDDFLNACYYGQCTDAKSLSCALWLQNVYRGDWSLTWQKTS